MSIICLSVCQAADDASSRVTLEAVVARQAVATSVLADEVARVESVSIDRLVGACAAAAHAAAEQQRRLSETATQQERLLGPT